MQCLGVHLRTKVYAVNLLATSCLAAQEAPSDEKVVELAPFYVHAWHFDSLDLEFPGDVAVIDRQTIEDSGSVTLPDLLQREANVRFASYNGKSSQAEVSLRGFGENSGLRVLVIVDGQRINRPDMGGIEWQMIPLDDIESIEVIRGGQNVLYGNYALAGVIQITTRRGGKMRTRVEAQHGSDGYTRESLDHAGGKGRWFWDANATYLWDTGYRENSTTWNRGLSGTLGRLFGAEQQHSLAISATLTEGYMQFPGPILYEQFLESPRQSTSKGDEETEYLTGLVTALWQGDYPWGDTQLNASINFRELEWSLGGIFAANDQWTATLSPRAKWGEDGQFLIGGIDLIQDGIDFDDFLSADREIVRAEAELSRFTAGPYLFGLKDLTDRLTLSGGVRYETAIGDYVYQAFVEDQLRPYRQTNRGEIPNPNYKNPPDVDPSKSYDEQITKSGVAGEASAVWRFTDTWSVWSGYDRVYRYPVLDETAAYQGFELSEPVNVDLDPETGHQVDVGIKMRQSSWSASASIYYLQLDGEIVYDNDANLNVNLADSRRWGGDLSLEYDRKKWGASTRWSFVDAAFTSGPFTGETVPLVPYAHGVSSVWGRPWKWLEGTLFYTWSSSRYQGNDFDGTLPKVDPFHRFDVRMSLEVADLTFTLRIDNLLDRAYAPLVYRGAYYPAPGRQWRAGLRYQF